MIKVYEDFIGKYWALCEWRKGRQKWYCDVIIHRPELSYKPICISSFPIDGGKRAVKKNIRDNPQVYHRIATLKKI